MTDNLPVRICQSLTNKGIPCTQPAMEGLPFCYNHIKSTAMVKSHDRYSAVMPSTLHSHYQHQLGDDKPKDLNEEIATLRTLMRGHFEKLQNKQMGDGAEQVTLSDAAVVLQMIEHIGRAVERQAKINPERVLTVPDVMTLITRMVDAITEEIPRDQVELRNRIVGKVQKYVQDMLASSTDFVYGQTGQ